MIKEYNNWIFPGTRTKGKCPDPENPHAKGQRKQLSLRYESYVLFYTTFQRSFSLTNIRIFQLFSNTRYLSLFFFLN